MNVQVKIYRPRTVTSRNAQLEEINASLLQLNDTLIEAVDSDENGLITFENIADGTYKLKLETEDPDIINVELTSIVTNNFIEPMEVELTFGPSRLIFRGRVLNLEQQPLAGATVSLAYLNDDEVEMIVQVLTDSDGVFEFIHEDKKDPTARLNISYSFYSVTYLVNLTHLNGDELHKFYLKEI